MTITVRKADVNDVPAIYDLLKRLSAQELLLPRSYVNLYEMLQTLHVAQDSQLQGRLAGVGALQVAWEDLAEVRSLAVPEELRGRGIGKLLTEAIEREALTIKVKKMFVLTYVPDFFIKLGYHIVSLDSLPQKIWAVCFNCVHYPNCKEIALVKDLGI
ncbi:MAG: N-acetyltransferase [Deltaproteobacteria bacterium]|jgi:amino-acid N-acetyltransferase|nr:N-acetyltransferase [Deltaproteobacteria bacterium]